MDSGAGPISPDEAFWLLGDETRVAILRAVWEIDEPTATFTAIRERVGNPDSGQFNYHLNKLIGVFLADVEDGYRLTQSGREVVRAIMAGTLTTQPEATPEPIDGSCVHCGGELVARYDGRGIIECGECGETLMWNEFPPAGLADRSGLAFARAFDRWTRGRFQLAMDGICPNCAAAMTTEIAEAADGPQAETASVHRCPNCKYEAQVPLFGHVIDHPAVVSFFYDRGIDVSDRPYWWWRARAEEFAVTIVSEAPWRAEVTVEADDRRLTLTLDEDLDVVDVSDP